MHSLVYLAICILLICIQTTLLPVFPDLFAHYDLMIPFIAYLTLFRSNIGILPVTLISGCMMDFLSGGFPGLYLITYLMILVCFRRTSGYFHFQNSTLYRVVVILAVLIENLFFSIIISIQYLSMDHSFYAGKIVIAQLLWAVISSPLIYYVFDCFFSEIDKLITGGLREKI